MLGVARPSEYGLQEVYNGHKRKHALKCRPSVSLLACFFIVINLWREGVTNGLCMLDNKMDSELDKEMWNGEGEYQIYGYSGYKARWFLEYNFVGFLLSPEKIAINMAMSKNRVMVE